MKPPQESVDTGTRIVWRELNFKICTEQRYAKSPSGDRIVPWAVSLDSNLIECINTPTGSRSDTAQP